MELPKGRRGRQQAPRRGREDPRIRRGAAWTGARSDAEPPGSREQALSRASG